MGFSLNALKPDTLDSLEFDFEKLTRSNAERLLRFWREADHLAWNFRAQHRPSGSHDGVR